MIFQVIKATWLLKMKYFLNKSTDLYQIRGIFNETNIDDQFFPRKNPCTHTGADVKNARAQVYASCARERTRIFAKKIWLSMCVS